MHLAGYSRFTKDNHSWCFIIIAVKKYSKTFYLLLIFINLDHHPAKVCRKQPLSLLDAKAEKPCYVLSHDSRFEFKSLSQRWIDHEANKVKLQCPHLHGPFQGRALILYICFLNEGLQINFRLPQYLNLPVPLNLINILLLQATDLC